MYGQQRDETELKVVHPVMFRSQPIGFCLAVALTPVGIGLLILLAWWLTCRCTTLTVTTERTIERTGILSRNTNEVRHADVRNVQVTQAFFQRMFGVGNIGISSAGQADVEIVVAGIRNPQEIADLIRKGQQSGRA